MPTIHEVLNQGWAIQQQGDYVTAERIYREVLRQVPGSAAAWCYLGIALHDQRKFVDSESAYRKSLELQAVFPIAWNNLGNTLRMLGRVDEADQAFEMALSQDPNYLSPLKNRGTLWVWTGQLERGLAAFTEGLKLAPQEPELHRNLGVISLLQGDFQRGWQEYRWRWEMPGFDRPSVTQPLWDGTDPAGKSFLLYPEQGLGDTIHFIRMAGELKRRGGTTVVQVPEKLIPLLRSCEGIDQLIADPQIPSTFDYHCSFIDVADRLNMDLSSIVAQTAYLSVPEALQQQWALWLESLTHRAHSAGGKKVGICWQGNPYHQADVFRSIPLEAFRPLTSVSGVQLICLQHGFGIEQLEQVDFGDQIVRLPENMDQANGAFMDTAAILKGLDLVVTSDTSLAHLAGALGVPVWVALPRVPDWRWLLDRDESPWYASMTLFRQPEMKDWDSVFGQIASRLSDR